jgi:hypothetical protein
MHLLCLLTNSEDVASIDRCQLLRKLLILAEGSHRPLDGRSRDAWRGGITIDFTPTGAQSSQEGVAPALSPSTTELRIGIFAPPMVEPFQPSLTLPYLAAQLREMSFAPVCHNLSSLFYVWLFRRMRLESMARYETLSRGIQTLKHPAAFFEAHQYKEALDNLDAYVTSLTDHDHLPYSLFPASRASVIESGTSLAGLVNAMRGTLLERFLLDYVGFTLQLENYDVIAFSATNIFQLASSIFIAKTLKEAGIKAHLTLGGHAVAVAGAQIVHGSDLFAYFDSIALGGGADVFATICDDYANGRGKRIYLSFDAAPHYRYKRSSFPVDRPYPLVLQHDINDLYLSPSQVFSIYSALGCSYGECTFCGSNRENAPYVPRYISVLVDEIEDLWKSAGINNFNLCDNNFDPTRAGTFCNELERRGLHGIYWQATSRVYRSLNADLLRRLRRNGCVMLNVGLESGSDRILELMKKGYTVDDVDAMLDAVHEVGLPVHLYCICRFPSETVEDSERTVQVLLRHISSCHSVYFQDYEGQLAAKVFADALGTDSAGYDAARMIARLREFPEIEAGFAVQGHLLRRRGYPFIEDHNFLYLAHELKRAEEQTS